MNSKDLIKYGLIALGAYLIYEYIQKNGGLSGIFGTTAAAGTVPPVPPPGISLPNASAIGTPGQVATVIPAPPSPVMATPPSTPVGMTRTINGVQYTWNGSAWMTNQTTPTPSTPTASISQQMLALAGTNSLNMDQWSFYYTQITGQPSPADPGSIDPNLYAGAGIVDRTTPTDVGTWLAIMQNQAPSLGLTGLGAMMRYTPAWLM